MTAKILIIDDDDDVVYTMSRLVKKMGHEVDHALTLKDGLSKICAEIFDMILLDVNLPDGCGLDIIDDLVSTSAHTQVIIMTAFSDPDGDGRSLLLRGKAREG